jgi:hypothetical protein
MWSLAVAAEVAAILVGMVVAEVQVVTDHP